MALIQTVHLSMANFKSAPVVPAVQNDTDRQVKMIIDDYTLTSGLTGKIAFERSDGTHYETAAELVLADNAFTADIDQALTQPGRTMVQLKVTDTLTVSSFSFVIFVEADNSGTVTPQEGIDLVTAVEAAEAAADRAESAATDAEEQAALVDADEIWGAIEDPNNGIIGYDTILSDSTLWERGGLSSSNGSNTSSTSTIRTKASAYVYLLAGSKVSVNTGYRIAVYKYSSDSQSSFVGRVRSFSAESYKIADSAYYRFAADLSGGGTIAVDNIPTIVSNILIKSKINEFQIAKEKTDVAYNFITKAATPVDVVESLLVWPQNIIPNTNITEGKYLKPNGSYGDNASYNTSDYFRIKANILYVNGNSEADFCFYDNDKRFIGSAGTYQSGGTFTTPDGTVFARRSSNGSVNSWLVNEGDTLLEFTRYEPIMLSSNGNSPFYKGEFILSKPDVFPWYPGYIDDYSVFGFNLTNTKYANIITLFDQLMADAETGYITKTAIGTAEGTDLSGNAYTIYEYAFVPRQYTNSMTNKKHPKILIDCSIHGFEKNSTFAFFCLLYDVVHNWDKHPLLSSLRNFVEIRIIPVSNPWGFDREDRRNANGVNLNRNFPAANWTAEEDSGEAPLDQSETQSLATWLQSNADMWFYFNVHANGHYNANGYDEANVCMPYNDIGDSYYNKMFDAFKRHIERQTAYLSKEYPQITPSQSQFVGKIQAQSATGTAGYADEYVCSYLKIALAMTLEGFNGLVVNEVSKFSTISADSTHFNSCMFANAIAELMYEYFD